jgi:hypothetical protein
MLIALFMLLLLIPKESSSICDISIQEFSELLLIVFENVVILCLFSLNTEKIFFFSLILLIIGKLAFILPFFLFNLFLY